MQRAKMFQTKNSILVLGATGNQGQAAVQCFLKCGYYHTIKALVRDAGTDKARSLVALGAELILGDMDDLNSLVSAMSEVDYVFAYTPFDLTTPDISTEFLRQIQRGQNIASAAEKSHIKHIIYTSGAMIKDIPDLPPAQVERFIEQSNTPYTILRPVFFMENWLWQIDAIKESREIVLPLSRHTVFQQIATKDIATIAQYVFRKPDEWVGRTIEIAGHACTVNELIEIFSNVFGVSIICKQVQWDEFETTTGSTMASVYRSIESGSKVNIAEVIKKCPGISLTHFEQYLSDFVTETPSYGV